MGSFPEADIQSAQALSNLKLSQGPMYAPVPRVLVGRGAGHDAGEGAAGALDRSREEEEVEEAEAGGRGAGGGARRAGLVIRRPLPTE